MEEELRGGFDEFVTLYFPGPKKHLEGKTEWQIWVAYWNERDDEKACAARSRRYELARTCQRRWLREVRKVALPQFRYLMVIENRQIKKDLMFHLLLANCDWGPSDFENDWKLLWNEMTGGTAYRKEIDERLGGFIWNSVVKRDCVLEVNHDGAHYWKQLFEEWEPKWNPY
jgi:hypothetical protein